MSVLCTPLQVKCYPFNLQNVIHLYYLIINCLKVKTFHKFFEAIIYKRKFNNRNVFKTMV